MAEMDQRSAVLSPLQPRSATSNAVTINDSLHNLTAAELSAAPNPSNIAAAPAGGAAGPGTNRYISNDPRIVIILFIEAHALSLSCIFTATLVVITIYGVVKEYNNSCDQNIKLWLSGTALRALLATSVKIIAEGVTRQYISYSGNPQIFHKIIEMLDVFGIVWFCIGNLLVFNDSGCKAETPFVFYTSLTYIVLVYFLFLSSMIIRISLAACPASVDLRSLLDSLHEAGLIPTNETVNWTAWLESYGCKEMSYADWRQAHRKASSTSPTAPLSNERRDSSGIVQINNAMHDGDQQQSDDLDGQMTSCPICLCDFDDNAQPMGDLENQAVPPASSTSAEDASDGPSNTSAMIVSFPCPARHIFHAPCLHRWLAVTGSRRQTAVTCPVCRDHVPDSTINPFRRYTVAANRLSMREQISMQLQRMNASGTNSSEPASADAANR
jgi:hypothetical protein